MSGHTYGQTGKTWSWVLGKNVQKMYLKKPAFIGKYCSFENRVKTNLKHM
jgi:hypothetical protein